MQRKNRLTGLLTLLVFVFSLVAPMVLVNKAEAASLQQAMIRFDRMKAATATTGTVCMKTAVTNVTEANVVVTFPTGFTVNAASNWTVSTAADIVFGSASWSGIDTATNVTGQVVTFPSSDLTANTLYCFNWTNSAALTTSSAGNDKTGTIASGGNSSSYATSIISSPDDQINITATVPSTFTFSLSGNSDTFASNLSTTAQLSNGVTATIATNAASGWVAWVKSANAALSSVSGTIPTIDTVDNTVSSLTAANYGYLLDVTFTDSGTGTGTVTQAANYGQEYDGNSSNTGGTLSTSFQPIAASSGTTDNDTVILKALARISAVQAAASDYTDTLTVVAAGRF